MTAETRDMGRQPPQQEQEPADLAKELSEIILLDQGRVEEYLKARKKYGLRLKILADIEEQGEDLRITNLAGETGKSKIPMEIIRLRRDVLRLAYDALGREYKKLCGYDPTRENYRDIDEEDSEEFGRKVEALAQFDPEQLKQAERKIHLIELHLLE